MRFRMGADYQVAGMDARADGINHFTYWYWHVHAGENIAESRIRE